MVLASKSVGTNLELGHAGSLVSWELRFEGGQPGRGLASEWSTWCWAQLEPALVGIHLEPRFPGADGEPQAIGGTWIVGPGQ